MKKILLTPIFLLLVLSACSENKPTFVGYIFVHEENGGTQIVGFDHDRIIFKWDDTIGVDLFETGYILQWTDDSTVVITLDEQNPYMDTNEWEIVVIDRTSFYTKDSGKKYRIKSNE